MGMLVVPCFWQLNIILLKKIIYRHAKQNTSSECSDANKVHFV